MAAKHPDPFICDICGQEETTEDELRIHMLEIHIEDALFCPFCDLGDLNADEMRYHVNSLHLHYLGPTESNGHYDVSSRESFDSSSLYDNLSNNASISNSPQRSTLSLNLNPERFVLDKYSPLNSHLCPMCDYVDKSPTKLQEHVNRQHFDLTSPSFPEFLNHEGCKNPFSCFLCGRSFETSLDLELHVNVEHNDILSPIRSTQVTPGDENSNDCCPVCGNSNFLSGVELASHIEDHFSPMSPNGILSPTTPMRFGSIGGGEALYLPNESLNQVVENYRTYPGGNKESSADHLLALEMERREREELKQREQKEFQILQAQYGMDNQGNFREQSIANMQRAVYAGEMSVADYYNRQVELCVAERDGVDDGHSCTKGLIPKIRTFSNATPNVIRTWMCTTVDHYGSTYGDKGWGCGYRNMQMLLSSLVHHTGYNSRLFNGKVAIPSISKLQELIETAWKQGFDPPGCEQLGGRIVNTRKWIGATEVVAFLSFFRIRTVLIDFHRPTGPNGTQPAMFNWVQKYFSVEEDFKPPLYLQHQGHSRTIVGLEELKDGSLQFLVLDPSHSKAQMEQFNNTSNANAMRLIRRPLSALKARQYQLLSITGLVQSEDEHQKMKVLHSRRIPP